jgi:ABC-type cobalamin/Fe3+-siderophores transport system ATPase subunit
MIGLRKLVVGHGACDIVEPIDLNLPPGQFTAIVGANGVGKTTLLKTIAGMQPSLSGQVQIDGLTLAHMRHRNRSRTLAYVDSETPLFGRMTVLDVVASGRVPFRPWWQWTSKLDDAAAVEAALESCGMTSFAPRKFDSLSSGERQRVWIAAAFAQNVPHLLLDEPTSRLDIRYAVDVLKLLKAKARNGATVVASMHDLERAALFADRIIMLGERRMIADGDPREVLNSMNLQRTYGLELEVSDENGMLWIRPKIF